MADDIVKKRRPWNYDESKRVFVLPKGTHFDTRILPIIQNLTAMGLTESDVGTIVGYQGENAVDWIEGLKKHWPDVKDALDIGRKIADSNLVAQMYKSACGYEYTKRKFKKDKETGEMVLIEEVVEHQPANAQLAMFVASNRMPEQFKHRIDVTKKGFVIDATQEISAEQIEKLAGALMKEAEKTKIIESEVIEASFEPETENVQIYGEPDV